MVNLADEASKLKFGRRNTKLEQTEIVAQIGLPGKQIARGSQNIIPLIVVIQTESRKTTVVSEGLMKVKEFSELSVTEGTSVGYFFFQAPFL